MNDSFWNIKNGTGPIFAVANHHGHILRPEVAINMALDAASRLQEEDPFTGEWANIAHSSLVAQHSRFEVDLNRPRESAVYLTPDDAWGLQVWKLPPPANIIEKSLAQFLTWVSRIFWTFGANPDCRPSALETSSICGQWWHLMARTRLYRML